MALAFKSVKQSYSSTTEVHELMETFRMMVNDCIRMGLKSRATSMKKLRSLSYRILGDKYGNIPSYYRFTAISKAAGIMAARKKSMKRGFTPKNPYVLRLLLVSCYQFKVEGNALIFAVGDKKKNVVVPLTKHTMESIENLEVRSFTITPTSLSISVRKNIESYAPTTFLGIDRNASNITVGNSSEAIQYSLAKIERIAQTTRQIVRTFKRNDVRIRRVIYSKYGARRKERVKRILHVVSKRIVEKAKKNQAAIVFEEIKDIRDPYKKGNFQGKNFRARMNSVPWYEVKRQIEYKAAWEGVPVIQLTKSETRGTSKQCPVCGERLQEDRAHRRELWCEKCKKWSDRDVVAVMNISYKGWLRFRQSKGEAVEAMVQEPRKEGVILKVDASKLASSQLKS